MNWWQVVEDNWIDLISCIKQFHPYYRNPNKEYSITAPGAEGACQIVRQQIVRQQIVNSDPVEVAEAAKQSKNKDLLITILSATWFGAPESRAVFSVPGFSVLCDLLEGANDDE